jgi:hypothetical protein
MRTNERSTTDEGVEESLEMKVSKAVRFCPITTCRVFSDDLTAQEIGQIWWNREEIAEMKRTCRCIAKKSRLLRSVSEVIIPDLHEETQDLTQQHNDGNDLESCLRLSRSARRFVRNYSTVGSQRGLERWISDELKLRNKRAEKNRARICRLQRLPGMTEDVVCQIAQAFSRFDRIIARLLGEADEFANKQRSLDPRRSVADADVAILPLSPRRSYQAFHDRHFNSSVGQQLGKDACIMVPLIQQITAPFVFSADSSPDTFQ